MPFIDFNKGMQQVPAADFDVTIVGAGAAGILLAVRLTTAGKKVLLIESGHFEEDEKKQQLNEVENIGKFLNNAVWGRKRAIGGTTLAWGGQSLPFTSIDFSHRPWVQNSGWPISLDDIADYYHKANAFMGIDDLNYHNDIFTGAKIKDPGIDPSLLDFHVAKWAKQPNFQVLYKKFLYENVTVLYNAHLLHIHQSAQGQIESITVQNFKKEKTVLGVNTLIISAGGIETTRILLNNNIGNHSGWLGKCFMEHPCIELGDVVTKESYQLQKYFNTHIWKKNKYSVRLSLSETFQQKHETLNCSASLLFRPVKDAFDPYAEIKAFTRDFNLKRLIKISGSYKNIIKSIRAYFSDNFYYKVNAVNKLVLMIEQEPLTDSYIALSNMQDEFGIPKAKISWEISPKTWETVLKISGILKTEMARLNLGEVKLYDHISSANKDWLNSLTDVNHHIGGCRMSASKEDGVVNKNLQVWDMPNLYICSCAVFPTASHSNPTLTMLALGERLSNYITKIMSD
jgi:hypothetical protein